MASIYLFPLFQTHQHTTMPDPVTIATLAGVVGLITKEIFKWGRKIVRSDCWGVHIERQPENIPTVIFAEVPVEKST